MSRLSRRKFLGGAAVAAGAAAVGMRRARADLPSGPPVSTTPECKILEIFLDGGLYHWPALGHPSFSPTVSAPYAANATNWTDIDTTDAWSPAVMGSADIEVDGVRYGPAAFPLVGSGLSSVTRVVATGHNLDPHEAAQLHTLTGGRMGRLRVAGLTSIVSHAWTQLYGPGLYAAVIETNSSGYSYPGFLAAKTGELSGAHKPIVIPTGNISAFTNMLSRSGWAPVDPILQEYQARYAGWLTHPADGLVRSATWDDYSAGLDQLFDYADIASLVSSASVPAASGSFTSNATRSAIHYAIDLLLATPLRAAAVMDHGVQRGYDSHNSDASQDQNAQAGNLWSVLRALGERAADLTGVPRILVVIHGEFGRIEYDNDTRGTEHWPRGYATTLIGGPISTPGWVGGFAEKSEDAYRPYAVDDSGMSPGYTPTDIVAAAAFAAGAEDPYGDYLDIDLAGYVAQTAASASGTPTAIAEVAASLLNWY